MPDKLVFTGLFCSSVFKSLLHKAKVTTKFGVMDTTPESTQPASAPHDALFQVSNPDKEVIPCPPLFSEVVQSVWGQPGSLTAPSGLDKKLEELMTLPTVDVPVASLSSSSIISTDIIDGLKSEERKSELAFRKIHQAATWAIKAATSTSFFNRASLIWLHQLQERLPPDGTRLHQDINKLVVATKYSTDASLNAAKFASRALASAVTSHRLFWLHN